MANADPIARFITEYEEALSSEAFDASRCALGTITETGQPAVRFVLLKGVDHRGFRFFTNYESRKAMEIEARPQVALCFHWHTTGKQVRVEGIASRISTEESEEYFHSRPRGSQLGAWSSTQSKPLQEWSEMSICLKATEERFRDQVVPLPPFWGGYRIAPKSIEFWQDGEDRMHRRELYTLEAGVWTPVRLWP